MAEQRGGPATGTTNWTYSLDGTRKPWHTVKTRAVDDSGNLETPGPEPPSTFHAPAPSLARASCRTLRIRGTAEAWKSG